MFRGEQRFDRARQARRPRRALSKSVDGEADGDPGNQGPGDDQGWQDDLHCRHVTLRLPQSARAGRRRPGFPVEGDHRFRWMTTTCSGRWRPGSQGLWTGVMNAVG
jgi:hypothetical protein